MAGINKLETIKTNYKKLEQTQDKYNSTITSNAAKVFFSTIALTVITAVVLAFTVVAAPDLSQQCVIGLITELSIAGGVIFTTIGIASGLLIKRHLEIRSLHKQIMRIEKDLIELK